MLKENKYLVGVIDDSPLTEEEYLRLQQGDSLYKHIAAPERPADKLTDKTVKYGT